MYVYFYDYKSISNLTQSYLFNILTQFMHTCDTFWKKKYLDLCDILKHKHTYMKENMYIQIYIYMYVTMYFNKSLKK